MNIACHKCTQPLHDASTRGAFSCDFCSTKHKKGEFRLRCQNKGCDFDLDQTCAQKFQGFNQTFSSQKSQCTKCKYPLLNATYTKNTKWSCNDCKGKFDKYSQLRLRCEAHDYDICGGCNAKYQSQFNVPQQQQGFNAPPQQQQGFNAPPQQQQGFNAPPQQQQGFNAPPQQQQGFNQPPQQQQKQQAKKPIIACHKCTTVKLIDATDRNTSWKCDFCARNHKKGDYRLRCNKHDFDVCFDCAQRFSDFDQSYDSWKHACKTCKHPLTNVTYSKNTKWSCDQCKQKYEKFSQLRLRCDQHDYDLCGNCCKTMQTQFNQPGAVITISTGFGNLTISSNSNQAPQQQPPQQQQFNQPPQQQQQGFNQPPQQQQGFNQPPQQQQQGFNQPPQQQQQTNGEQVFVGGVLQQDQVLRAGQFMSSPSNLHHLFMQHDGNLVLYSDRSFQPQFTVWSTNTSNKGQAPHLLKLQADGNLVIYDRTNTTTWASNTYNTGSMPYKLCIQEDRNICLYDRNNQVTFQTNTAAQQQQQGFNAPPQQQQGFNAPPQQQQGFNAPPGQNPQLAQIEKDQAALNQQKQQLEQEKQKLNNQLSTLQSQNNAENQKLQAELAQLPNKQGVDQQQLKAKQDAEMQQLIQRQEQERQKLATQQQQATQKLTTTQTQEKTKIEVNHQKIHQQQQVKVSKVQTDLSKVDQQIHGLQAQQSTIDQRRKMIPQQQQGFNQPPISFQ